MLLLEHVWGQVLQAYVPSHAVVMAPPVLDHSARLVARAAAGAAAALLPVEKYASAAIPVLLLVGLLPFKAILVANGASLMERQQYRTALVFNVIEASAISLVALSFEVSSATKTASVFLLATVIVGRLLHELLGAGAAR